MTITTEVTSQDYRALQWSILIDRAKLHWCVAACLPLAALLFWFAVGAEASVALVLRVIASLLAGVGLLLLAVMAGQFASRNKPVDEKRVPLGTQTYELTEKTITVTSGQRRMEFPVSALHSVTETPSHFFVVVRQGADFIIPRRGLDAGQIQALQSFRDVVAFSSLHVDHGDGAAFSPQKLAERFAYAKWVSVLCTMALPFTFGSGPMKAGAFLWALLAGALMLASVLLTWRTRRHLWSAPMFLVPMLFSHWSGVRERHVPDAHFYQWLLAAMFFFGLPLVLLPRFCRRFAGIEVDEPSPPSPQPSS